MVVEEFPVDADRSSHEGIPEMFQEILAEETEKETVLEAVYARVRAAGLIPSLGAPSCVMVTVRNIPLPEIVTVAERGEAEGL